MRDRTLRRRGPNPGVCLGRGEWVSTKNKNPAWQQDGNRNFRRRNDDAAATVYGWHTQSYDKAGPGPGDLESFFRCFHRGGCVRAKRTCASSFHSVRPRSVHGRLGAWGNVFLRYFVAWRRFAFLVARSLHIRSARRLVRRRASRSGTCASGTSTGRAPQLYVAEVEICEVDEKVLTQHVQRHTMYLEVAGEEKGREWKGRERRERRGE
jgi:hypothetical protein